MNTKTPIRAGYNPPAGQTTKEGAEEILNVSRSTVDRLLKSGALKPMNTVRRKPLIFRIADLEALRDGTTAARILTVREIKKARQL